MDTLVGGEGCFVTFFLTNLYTVNPSLPWLCFNRKEAYILIQFRNYGFIDNALKNKDFRSISERNLLFGRFSSQMLYHIVYTITAHTLKHQ